MSRLEYKKGLSSIIVFSICSLSFEDALSEYFIKFISKFNPKPAKTFYANLDRDKTPRVELLVKN